MAKGDPGFASAAYQRAKARWRGLPPRNAKSRQQRDPGSSTPFSGGRDPRLLGEVLTRAAEDLGWLPELDQAKLLSDWPELVGETTAPHTRVVELRDGLLIVQCDSTAWATELRRMRGPILTRILERYPEAGIEDLRFLAPGAPSWRHGSRVVQGRGPRDTYG